MWTRAPAAADGEHDVDVTPEGMAAMAAAVVLIVREIERITDRVLRARGMRRTRRTDRVSGSA
jgi:hypothetical protein